MAFEKLFRLIHGKLLYSDWPSNNAATAPVEKFWKRISTALAKSRIKGSALACMVKGTSPPTEKRIKAVSRIKRFFAVRNVSRKKRTDATMRAPRISSALSTTSRVGTVKPPACVS